MVGGGGDSSMFFFTFKQMGLHFRAVLNAVDNVVD